MDSIRIVEVRRLEVPEGQLIAFSIDEPVAGQHLSGRFVALGGWAVGNGRPVPEVQIRIAGLDWPLQRLAVGAPRPDVAAYLAGIPHAAHSGFYGQFSVLGLAPRFKVVVCAVGADQQVIPLAEVCGEREGGSAPSASSEQLQPILVTGLARSGTTWLMRLLGAHPSIVVYSRYPYEMHMAGYWWQMCRVLTAPPNGIGIAHPDRFWFDLERVGPNPFFTTTVERDLGEEGWFDADYASQIMLHARSMIDRFYRRVAAAQRCAANVSHFAEKQVVPYYSWLVWELYPGAREIFLVRDFRDAYCSILAFNRKRGVTVFGRENVHSDEAYAAWLGERIVDLQRNWEARADRALLVRYENLIRSPAAEMTRVLDYLGLDSGVATVQALLARADAPDAELQQHRTISDGIQSIGRWQRDLSPALQAVVNDVFGDSLRAFGYPV